MILPGFATGLSSVSSLSGSTGASLASVRARAATASRFAMNTSCPGNGYEYRGSTSRAAVTSRTLSPSTSPSRPSPNLQNRICLLSSPAASPLRGGARRGVPPCRSVFLLELHGAYVGAAQILRVFVYVRHEQISGTDRLGAGQE